ncbi:hypothetical protein KIPB_017127, partial [Kipferlia bialata]|eukprot:g17127.t1
MLVCEVVLAVGADTRDGVAILDEAGAGFVLVDLKTKLVTASSAVTKS